MAAAAAVTTASVSLPSAAKSSSLPTRTSFIVTSPVRISFRQVPGYCRDGSPAGKVGPIRAQITTEAPAKVEKVSKKMEEGVVVNKFKPREPFIGRCLLNTKITGDDAPGETWHMVFTTDGEVPYREGQSVGVIPDGVDPNGKPHKLRLYSIASSAIGDFGDSKTENDICYIQRYLCTSCDNHLDEYPNQWDTSSRYIYQIYEEN